MRRTPLAIAALAAAALTLTPLTAAAANPAASTAPRVSTLDLLNGLAVKDTGHSSRYDSDAFSYWIDANGDVCTTRSHVLAAESRISTTRTRGCTIATGRWVSPYDGMTMTNPSDAAVDQLVPLAEAWHSGAGLWTDIRRNAFANDYLYSFSLVAVTESVDRAKGTDDPAEWMPPKASFACSYAKMWVGVKHRWNLSVDTAEKAALTHTITTKCADDTIPLKERPAKDEVKYLAGVSDGGSTSPDKRYSTCTAAKADGANTPYRIGEDSQYAWYPDGDGDGLSCE